MMFVETVAIFSSKSSYQRNVATAGFC